MPDGPFAIPAFGRSWGPYDHSGAFSLLPNRGAFYRLTTAPAGWRLSTVLQIPEVILAEGTIETSNLGFYAYTGLEAPSFGLDAGLVLDPRTSDWEAFIWEWSSEESVWRQAALSSAVGPGSEVLIVLEVSNEGAGCDLRLYRVDDWSLLGWYHHDISGDMAGNPDMMDGAYAAISRSNLAMQFKLVSAVATVSGDVPAGVGCRNWVWRGSSLAGLCEASPGEVAVLEVGGHQRGEVAHPQGREPAGQARGRSVVTLVDINARCAARAAIEVLIVAPEGEVHVPLG